MDTKKQTPTTANERSEKYRDNLAKRVITVLRRRRSALTVKQMADVLGVHPSHASSALTRAEKWHAGNVVKVKVPQQRKGRPIYQYSWKEE